MSPFRASFSAALLTAGLLLCRPVLAQQEFKTTPAKELASNPQRFWARGVVFRDTLAEPISGKGGTRVGGRKAYPFQTKVVGACYADESILPVLRELPAGKEYIYTATVYSDKVGLFNRKTKYLILVSGVMAPVNSMGALTDEIEEALAAQGGTNVFLPALEIMRELMGRVQEAMTAEAATEGYSRGNFFDPQSPQFEKLDQIIRRALNDLENSTKVPGREHLVQFIKSLIAIKEGVLLTPNEGGASEAPAAIEATPTPEPSAEPSAAVEAPAPEPAPVLRLTVHSSLAEEETMPEPAALEPEPAESEPADAATEPEPAPDQSPR